MIYVLISIALIAIIAVVANKLAIVHRISGELARKLVHMTLGLSIFTTSLMTNKTWTAALISLSLGAVIVAKESGLFESFRRVGRHSNGDLYYLIGALIALILASSQAAFAIAILVLTFADALAALVGKAIGRHKVKLLGETKSVEGSLTFALATAIIVAVFTLVGAPVIKGDYALIGILPIMLTPLEALSPKGLDNLTLPVVATLLVNLLS
jgi:phytol kinase